MRILIEPTLVGTLDGLAEYAEAVDRAGLDGVLLPETRELPSALVAAASVAAVNDSILLAAEAEVGDRHPLELAEEATVVDQASRGRLILVVHGGARAEADCAEAVDLIRTATAGRPFRFSGRRWSVPHEGHGEGLHGRHQVRLTPGPFGARLEIWIEGGDPATWLARGLGVVIARPPRGVLPIAATGAPRAGRLDWTGADAVIDRLRSAGSVLGQDWAIIRAPLEAVAEIGKVVRPRLALDPIPEALLDHWSTERGAPRPDL